MRRVLSAGTLLSNLDKGETVDAAGLTQGLLELWSVGKALTVDLSICVYMSNQAALLLAPAPISRIPE